MTICGTLVTFRAQVIPATYSLARALIVTATTAAREKPRGVCVGIGRALGDGMTTTVIRRSNPTPVFYDHSADGLRFLGPVVSKNVAHDDHCLIAELWDSDDEVLVQYSDDEADNSCLPRQLARTASNGALRLAARTGGCKIHEYGPYDCHPVRLRTPLTVVEIHR